MPELETINEKKAQISMEIMEFRRELDALKQDKQAYLLGRETEALAVVQSVMTASHRLLSEAEDTAEAVDKYLETVRGATNDLKEAQTLFAEWKDMEEQKLLETRTFVQTKIDQMAIETDRLVNLKQEISGACKELETKRSLSKKDFEEARKERAKLLKNKQFMDSYGTGKTGQ